MSLDSDQVAPPQLPKDSIWHLQQNANTYKTINFNETSLEKRMYNLMINPNIHDVTFLIGENKVEYTSIRNMLSCVSPIFYKMFYSSNMKESNDKAGKNLIINIPDINILGFENLLYYTFQGINGIKNKINSQNVLHTLKISDKYQINGLMAM